MTIQIFNEAQFTDNLNVAQIVRIFTDASLATIETAGWLAGAVQEGYVISAKNKYLISYNSGANVDFFNLSISSGVYTLSIANSDVVLPTIANHLAVFKDVNGTLTEDVATAINGGNIQAGLSGTAGTLASFPSTAANGSLILAAINNAGGNFSTTISNAASVGQAQVISIPDSGAAAANLILSKSAADQHITVSGLAADAGAFTSGISTGGFVGLFKAFPTTASKGFIAMQAAVNATGNFGLTISNATAQAQASTITVPDPGVATSSFILADSAGTQNINTGNLAVLLGNLQAGSSGHAGIVTSFPGTAANGSFIFKAVNNAGNFNSTLSNSNIAQATVYSLPDPGVATTNILLADNAGTQHVTTGSLSVDVGNLAAGSSGHAGTVSSFPGTAANGQLILAGVNAGGAFNTTISNGTMGQSTIYTMGDIGAATGGLVVATSAIRMKSVAQASVAGGAAAQTVTDTFCTTGSMVVACWNDTTNAVQIQKVAAGNGSFVVTSTADPGASHLNYIITK